MKPNPFEPLRLVAPEEPGSPYPKCTNLFRFGARAVDTGLAWGIYTLFRQTGEVTSLVALHIVLLVLLFSDGMFNGQSLGKRIFGIKAVHVPTRQSARFLDSAVRNSPWAAVILLGLLPQPLGRAAFACGIVLIGGLEGIKVLRHPLGLRTGDLWAQTQVVDGKAVSGVSSAQVHLAPAESVGRYQKIPRSRRCASP